MLRVVLDTNYFRGLRAADLAPLRAMGMSISVGASAFYETWAAAARERNARLIIGPARELANVVDPEYPIAPNGGDLLLRFAVVRERNDGKTTSTRYSAWARLNWELAASGNVDERSLEVVGLQADEYLRNRGEKWMKYANRWPPEERQILKGFTPRQARSRLVAHLTRDLGPRGLRAPLVRERLHAFYQVAALHLWSTARGATTATENDSEDLISLQHLAEPAYFVTHDTKLTKAVDEADTYQAPWVLTLSELLRADRPVGRPWGSRARAAAAAFRRTGCSGCRICGQSA